MHKIQELAIEVRRLATENPGNNYYKTTVKNCSYFKGHCANGTIGCIVGQAARNIKYDEFLELAEIEEEQDIDTSASTLLLKMEGAGKFISDINFIQSFQSKQDKGYSWASCLEHAS